MESGSPSHITVLYIAFWKAGDWPRCSPMEIYDLIQANEVWGGLSRYCGPGGRNLFGVPICRGSDADAFSLACGKAHVFAVQLRARHPITNSDINAPIAHTRLLPDVGHTAMGWSMTF